MVITGSRLERGGSFVGDDAAIGNDDRARADLVHLFQDMGRDDHQLVLAQFIDQAPHFMLLIGIETIRGFIQNQDLRIVDQCLGQSHAAPKALGEGFDHLIDHRCKAQAIDHDAASLASPLAGQTADVGDKVEEFADRHFAVTGCAFGQIPHAGFRLHRRFFNIVAADRHMPGRR